MSTGQKTAPEAGLDRSDFLKALGAGLGAVGLAGLAGGQAFADMEKKGKYVFAITHGGDDPNRSIFALLMAQVVAKKGWGAVHVWMTLGGADLAHVDKTARIESPIFKKFGTALEIMEDIRQRGGTFGVCPPCAEYAGAVDDKKHAWIDKAGGDWLMENIQGAWTLWV
ncbi:MAG: hypothetical protein IH608_09715 [Proteobacteria bacterium]|nr:hypothetical protein [Pseudomonadota bacterium]